MEEAGDDDGSGIEGLSDDNQGDGEGSEIREMKHRLEKFGWISEDFLVLSFGFGTPPKEATTKEKCRGGSFLCVFS